MAKILLVEDERIQRVALASIIKSNFIDVRIYEAASQAEAIKIINEKDIHLFFIDIQLFIVNVAQELFC